MIKTLLGILNQNLIISYSVPYNIFLRYEDYHNPRTALYVTLLRTFLLNVVIIGTLTVFWLTHPQEVFFDCLVDSI